jgi:hypothetical protein
VRAAIVEDERKARRCEVPIAAQIPPDDPDRCAGKLNATLG